MNDATTVRRNFECTEFQAKVLEWTFLHPLIKGAYTELWAALTPDLSLDDPCVYVAPWGRKSYNRWDIEEALEKRSYERFVQWCNKASEEFQ